MERLLGKEITPSMTLTLLKKEAKNLSKLTRIKNYQKFFKFQPNFLGLTVPISWQLAKRYQDLDFFDLKNLLKTNIHEYKLIVIFILRLKYNKSTEPLKSKIVDFYLNHLRYINNWDLVDSSAYQILGNYLLDKKKERQILYQLVKSENLWERRIAIVTTLVFIKNNQLSDTFKLAKYLINDEEILVCQACGWLLREAGKKDQTLLLRFLYKNIKSINRTTLRYSIEKLATQERKTILAL